MSIASKIAFKMDSFINELNEQKYRYFLFMVNDRSLTTHAKSFIHQKVNIFNFLR